VICCFTAFAVTVLARDSFVLASAGEATKTIDAKDKVSVKSFLIFTPYNKK
jgi:hypothetical protein